MHRPSQSLGGIGEDPAAVDDLDVHGFLLSLLIEKDNLADTGIEYHPPAHEAGHPAARFSLLDAEDVKRGVIHQVEVGADDRIGFGMDGVTDLVVFTAGDVEPLADALPFLQAASNARSGPVVTGADDRVVC